MSSDTDKCPKCGEPVVWTAFSVSCTNDDCMFCLRTNDKDLRMEMAYETALHRIRELEALIAQFRDSLRKIVVECNSGKPLSEKIVSIYDIAREEQICAGNFSSQEMSQNGFAADSAKIGGLNQMENSEPASCFQTSEAKAESGEEPAQPTAAAPCSFAVLAHRWGDADNHTYLVCVVDSEDEAKHWSEREEQDRGGKYSCSIWKCGKVTASPEFTFDDSPLVSDSVDRITKARVIPEGKTVVQNMIEDAKRDKRLAELETENERLKKALAFIEQAADVRGVVTDQYSVIRGVAREALKK